MTGASHAAHPVETLRDRTMSLEAAMLLCLAKPAKEAVHRLRTSTRRVEAQLELLSLLPGLPLHDEGAREARGLLKKLRHAGGRVRDIDVQRSLIRDVAQERRGANGNRRVVREEARTLRRKLKRRRDKEVEDLVRLLRKQRKRVPLVFEELLVTLAPAEMTELKDAQLTALVRGWYGRVGSGKDKASHGMVSAGSAGALGEEELHGIRKRAKLARYLAESAPESAAGARGLAARFEALQQAGGQWHDWHVLAMVAEDELGGDAELPRRFADRAARALRDFQRQLRYRI